MKKTIVGLEKYKKYKYVLFAAIVSSSQRQIKDIVYQIIHTLLPVTHTIFVSTKAKQIEGK